MKSLTGILILALSGYATAENWENSSQEHMNTPAGKKYELAAAEFTASRLGEIMGACMGTDTPPEFSLYFKITDNGTVAEKSASVSLPVTSCFSQKLGALIWPKPPFSPFVFKLGMFGNSGEFGL